MFRSIPNVLAGFLAVVSLFIVVVFLFINPWKSSSLEVRAEVDVETHEFVVFTDSVDFPADLLASIALDVEGSVDVKGKLDDGTKYKYWQTPGCCREFVLKHPDGTKEVMYDQDDNNVILDHKSDSYSIEEGYGSIIYSPDGIKKENWQGRVMTIEEAMIPVSEWFNYWRIRILRKHGYIESV